MFNKPVEIYQIFTIVVLTLLSLIPFSYGDSRVIIGSSVGGIVGLIILILDVIAIVEVLVSSKSLLGKLLWILLVVIFPVGGLIIYLCFGRHRSVDHVLTS